MSSLKTIANTDRFYSAFYLFIYSRVCRLTITGRRMKLGAVHTLAPFEAISE